MEGKKFIDVLRLPLINLGFRAIERWLIEKINFVPLKQLLKQNLDLMVEIVDKLTDKDPNNNEQLKAVWEEYRTETSDSVLESTIDGIKLLVKNKEEADFLIETLRLLIKSRKDMPEEPQLVSRTVTTTSYRP